MKPAGRVGDIAFCPSDSHGCPGCAHPVQGPAIQGSPNVLINDLPALRVGDPGIHAACCGGNQWKAKEGARSVLVNDKSAHRKDDVTRHCGGRGALMVGSANVLVGNDTPELPIRAFDQAFILRDKKTGMPIADVRYRITLEQGRVVEGVTDPNGYTDTVCSNMAEFLSLEIYPAKRAK